MSLYPLKPSTPRALLEALQIVAVVLAWTLIAAIAGGVAHAQECTKVHPVQVQDPAPCTGVVMSADDAVKLGQCLAADLPECRGLLQVEKELRKADAEKHASVLRAATERGDRCCEALDEAAQIVPVAVPWHRRPQFVAPVTAVLVGAAAVLITLAITGDL